MTDKTRRLAPVAIAAAAVLAVCVLVVLMVSRRPDTDNEDELQAAYKAQASQYLSQGESEAQLLQEQAQEPQPIPADEPQPAQVLLVHSDFSELYEANPDFAGWLKAGDIADCPVVQRDNDYYLSHDFNMNEDPDGTVFVNGMNSLVPRDEVLIIHGHNAADGHVFGRLDRYMDSSYIAEYPLISFRTLYDGEETLYTPVSVFNASMVPENEDYFDLYRFSFGDGGFREYLNEVTALSIFHSKVDVNTEDALLILATCSYFQEDGRLIVVCRALREGETGESIEALYQP